MDTAKQKRIDGLICGLLGVVIFSGSLPATRVAVADLSPLFLTGARAVIAAALAGLVLLATRQARPDRRDLMSLAVIAVGVVVGFPLLSALALQHMTSARSIVFIGLLPLSTAIFGVMRGGERPRPLFWLFSGLGSATVIGFAFSSHGDGAWTSDLLMLASIVICGLGYAEGGILARRLGGWQVICWALVLSAPIMLVVAALDLPADWSAIGMPAWAGLAYVSVFSMLIGFIFWYRGLAMGGIASVGQLQLLQPFFALALAGLVLREAVPWTMVAAAALTVASVAVARRYA